MERRQHSFGTLAEGYNLETICTVAKELLDAGISTQLRKPRRTFLGCSGPHIEVGKRAESSDFDATRSELDTLEDVITSEDPKVTRWLSVQN